MGKYPAFLKMRVAQEDLEIIEEKAALLKITKSEFVSRAIRNSHVYILPSKEIKEFTSELRHIGVNVMLFGLKYRLYTETMRHRHLKR